MKVAERPARKEAQFSRTGEFANPVPIGPNADRSGFDDIPLSRVAALRFLRKRDKLFPSGGQPIGIFTDREEGRIIFLPNPKNANGSRAVISDGGHLGSVEIHRELMTAAARWIMAWKLWSVLSARMAMRLNSLSLQKKFSMR